MTIRIAGITDAISDQSAGQSAQTLWHVSQLLETARNVVIQAMPILCRAICHVLCLLSLLVNTEQSP